MNGPGAIDIGAWWLKLKINEKRTRNLPKKNSLRMFSREVPWAFYCNMVEIPQKLQESNSRITKIRRPFSGKKPPTPQTLLDKIQTLNRLKIVSDWILHRFFKIFGGGVAPRAFLHKKKKNKKPHNSSHIIPCKWGENSRIFTHPIGFEWTQNASFTSVFHKKKKRGGTHPPPNDKGKKYPASCISELWRQKLHTILGWKI